MYYKLTKEEYKKNEKEFKNTYVGRKMFNSVVGCYVALIVILFDIILDSICDLIDKVTFTINAFDICNYIVLLSVLIASVLIYIHYEKELKDYINNKSKK